MRVVIQPKLLRWFCFMWNAITFILFGHKNLFFSPLALSSKKIHFRKRHKKYLFVSLWNFLFFWWVIMENFSINFIDLTLLLLFHCMSAENNRKRNFSYVYKIQLAKCNNPQVYLINLCIKMRRMIIDLMIHPVRFEW
jgi:hypothetical protein